MSTAHSGDPSKPISATNSGVAGKPSALQIACDAFAKGGMEYRAEREARWATWGGPFPPLTRELETWRSGVTVEIFGDVPGQSNHFNIAAE